VWTTRRKKNMQVKGRLLGIWKMTRDEEGDEKE
jgi:hypothetical protein